MFIVLTGDPWVGFTAAGPYGTEEEAGSAGEFARSEYGGTDWYVLRLAPPAPCAPRRTAKAWRAAEEAWIRFSGAIGEKWTFTGPFDHDRPEHPMLQLQPLGPDGEIDDPHMSEDAGASQL